MNDHDIRDACRALKLDWDKIADRLTRAVAKDRTGGTVPDGYPRRTLNTDIPANDPESLTSVEAAADDRVFGRLERDPVHEAVVHARSALSQAALAVGSLVDNLNRAEELGRFVKPQGHTSTECKSVGCDSPAVARGWCNACRMWIARNRKDGEPDPLTVPASVIDERTKRREKAS